MTWSYPITLEALSELVIECLQEPRVGRCFGRSRFAARKRAHASGPGVEGLFESSYQLCVSDFGISNY